MLAVLLVLPSGDRLHITPALDVASEHAFSLVQWHITNFFGKWAHLAREAIPGQRPTREERIAIVDEYLQTSRLAEKEERLIEGRIARAGGANSAKGAVISREYLDELLGLQRGLRPKAEEAVESELSAVLHDQGFGLWGDVLFPPVDIRFGHLPTIIVTSRRDKIARLERRLLRPELEYIERGRLEDELLEEHDLSAIVGNLAGLSTYPTLVKDTDSLRSVLRTAAHEWLHVYWFFRPFGQAFWISEEMATLNETAADIAGRELGDETFVRMGGDLDENARRYLPQEERDPRFTRMMRETRQRTEELLAEGKVARGRGVHEGPVVADAAGRVRSAQAQPGLLRHARHLRGERYVGQPHRRRGGRVSYVLRQHGGLHQGLERGVDLWGVSEAAGEEARGDRIGRTGRWRSNAIAE